MAPWFSMPSLVHGRAFGLAAATRYCLSLAQSHYENFPIALSLFQREEREALASIYAFARIADDFSDEPEFHGMRERLIDGWEVQLRRCFSGEAEHPVFIALEPAVARHGLAMEPFLDLLDAFRQDCCKTRYETFDELLDYCRRSANPVGRLVLRVLGIHEEDFGVWSDHLCTALQLTNFWQDLSQDLARARVYLPLEDLRRLNVRLQPLLAGEAAPSFGSLMRFEIDRTRDLFRKGKPLLAQTGYPGSLYFTAVYLGGRTVLRMVKDLKEEILFKRPVLGRRSVARILVRAGAGRVPVLSELIS